MSLEYWDWRTDAGPNLFVTPELRCRFLRIEPGQPTGSHTHDLGHEVFLVLDGEIEFDVAGHKAILGPGQMCVARVDEPHTLTALGDRPATIYLSVTPHVSPTHTFWDEHGRPLPPRYRTVDEGWEHAPATPELIVDYVQAARLLAIDAEAHADAAEAIDGVPSGEELDALWGHVRATLKAAFAMAALWNQVAPRSTIRE